MPTFIRSADLRQDSDMLRVLLRAAIRNFKASRGADLAEAIGSIRWELEQRRKEAQRAARKKRGPRVPAWAESRPPCPKTCGGTGAYLGTERSGGEQWAMYRCACGCAWDRKRMD